MRGICKTCGRPTESRPSRPKKYCSQSCYITAKEAKRKDPESVEFEIPDNFSEYLSQPTLYCLVKECSWQGKHLSVHVFEAHGILSGKLKELVGFNRGEGLVSPSLSEALSNRPKVGIAIQPHHEKGLPTVIGRYSIPRRLQQREHQAKIIKEAGTGPKRICMGCNSVFNQSTPFGKAKFCCIPCREMFYSKDRKEKTKERGLVRLKDEEGKFVWIAKSGEVKKA